MGAEAAHGGERRRCRFPLTRQCCCLSRSTSRWLGCREKEGAPQPSAAAANGVASSCACAPASRQPASRQESVASRRWRRREPRRIVARGGKVFGTKKHLCWAGTGGRPARRWRCSPSPAPVPTTPPAGSEPATPPPALPPPCRRRRQAARRPWRRSPLHGCRQTPGARTREGQRRRPLALPPPPLPSPPLPSRRRRTAQRRRSRWAATLAAWRWTPRWWPSSRAATERTRGRAGARTRPRPQPPQAAAAAAWRRRRRRAAALGAGRGGRGGRSMGWAWRRRRRRRPRRSTPARSGRAAPGGRAAPPAEWECARACVGEQGRRSGWEHALGWGRERRGQLASKLLWCGDVFWRAGMLRAP